MRFYIDLHYKSCSNYFSLYSLSASVKETHVASKIYSIIILSHHSFFSQVCKGFADGHVLGYRYLPWNKGQMAHALKPDTPMNWPTAHSRKNSGTPPMMTNRKYGIRKAPAKKKLSMLIMQTFEETRKLDKKHVGLIYKSLSVQKKLCDLTTPFLPLDLI